jgi:hypothetical protein
VALETGFHAGPFKQTSGEAESLFQLAFLYVCLSYDLYRMSSVQRRELRITVVPAQAGTHRPHFQRLSMDSRLRGNDESEVFRDALRLKISWLRTPTKLE